MSCAYDDLVRVLGGCAWYLCWFLVGAALPHLWLFLRAWRRHGWRYCHRRWCGWFPVQFCVVCGRAYWGGWPSAWLTRSPFSRWRFRVDIWQPWMIDYCSPACCRLDWERCESSRSWSSSTHAISSMKGPAHD